MPVAADLVRRTGGAAETAADELVIERRNGSALLSFPTADVDVACVQRAQLVVTQLSGHGRINVWVSLETEAATLPDGTALGTTVIAHESPWVSAPSAPPGGHATWDVLTLLRWQQAHQPGTEAVVLVVKPMPNQDHGQLSFAALSQVTWPGCTSPARPPVSPRNRPLVPSRGPRGPWTARGPVKRGPGLTCV